MPLIKILLSKYKYRNLISVCELACWWALCVCGERWIMNQGARSPLGYSIMRFIRHSDARHSCTVLSPPRHHRCRYPVGFHHCRHCVLSIQRSMKFPMSCLLYGFHLGYISSWRNHVGPIFLEGALRVPHLDMFAYIRSGKQARRAESRFE